MRGGGGGVVGRYWMCFWNVVVRDSQKQMLWGSEFQMVGQMAPCVQESHHLEQRLLLRHFIFSLATYHAIPWIQFYFTT